ncbi:hypothetical protein F5Y04DRAFT_247457 [Hypomontagnella monticulosa]|nr:hypothetical protein F5Y04DRAFT_247457 [Hypomontagnella monticulosa]
MLSPRWDYRDIVHESIMLPKPCKSQLKSSEPSDYHITGNKGYIKGHTPPKSRGKSSQSPEQIPQSKEDVVCQRIESKRARWKSKKKKKPTSAQEAIPPEVLESLKKANQDTMSATNGDTDSTVDTTTAVTADGTVSSSTGRPDRPPLGKNVVRDFGNWWRGLVRDPPSGANTTERTTSDLAVANLLNPSEVGSPQAGDTTIRPVKTKLESLVKEAASLLTEQAVHSIEAAGIPAEEVNGVQGSKRQSALMDLANAAAAVDRASSTPGVGRQDDRDGLLRTPNGDQRQSDTTGHKRKEASRGPSIKSRSRSPAEGSRTGAKETKVDPVEEAAKMAARKEKAARKKAKQKEKATKTWEKKRRAEEAKQAIKETRRKQQEDQERIKAQKMESARPSAEDPNQGEGVDVKQPPSYYRDGDIEQLASDDKVNGTRELPHYQTLTYKTTPVKIRPTYREDNLEDRSNMKAARTVKRSQAVAEGPATQMRVGSRGELQATTPSSPDHGKRTWARIAEGSSPRTHTPIQENGKEKRAAPSPEPLGAIAGDREAVLQTIEEDGERTPQGGNDTEDVNHPLDSNAVSEPELELEFDDPESYYNRVAWKQVSEPAYSAGSSGTRTPSPPPRAGSLPPPEVKFESPVENSPRSSPPPRSAGSSFNPHSIEIFATPAESPRPPMTRSPIKPISPAIWSIPPEDRRGQPEQQPRVVLPTVPAQRDQTPSKGVLRAQAPEFQSKRQTDQGSGTVSPEALLPNPGIYMVYSAANGYNTSRIGPYPLGYVYPPPGYNDANGVNGLNPAGGYNTTNGHNRTNGYASINGHGLTNGQNSANGFNAVNGVNGINGQGYTNGHRTPGTWHASGSHGISNGYNVTHGGSWKRVPNGYNAPNGNGAPSGNTTTNGYNGIHRPPQQPDLLRRGRPIFVAGSESGSLRNPQPIGIPSRPRLLDARRFGGYQTGESSRPAQSGGGIWTKNPTESIDTHGSATSPEKRGNRSTSISVSSVVSGGSTSSPCPVVVNGTGHDGTGKKKIRTSKSGSDDNWGALDDIL